MTILENLHESIKQVIKNAVEKAIANNEIDPVSEYDIQIETPREKEHGDFATNIAMMLTKILRKPPRTIADAILKNMDFANTYIAKAEVAGAGFINFFLDNSWLYDVVGVIDEQGDNYGRINLGNGKKVMVEFVSANPTGPMHMGNARGGALGDCLASVLDWAGYNVTREFYVNDAGNQIEKFAVSLEARYIQELKGEDAIEFPEDAYHGDDIRQHAKNFIALYGDKYLEAEQTERRKALVDYALKLNIQALKDDMDLYRIHFDNWFYESTLHNSNEVMETIELLKQSGYTYEKEDALWFKTTEFGLDKDDVLIRANKIPTYFAADIAYHRNKFSVRGFDKVINIWGADHHGHIARMKGAMQALGIDPDRLDIITMQLVRLMRGGEIVRMSKRTGKSITLHDLLEETNVDAARFFFNLRQASSHFDFDLELAVEQSNENPVFYVQYAHARICSIIRHLSGEGINVKNAKDIDLTALVQPQELDLLRKLTDLTEEIKAAATTMEPSRLTHYLMDLAALFHSFYNACRVNCDDQNLMHARLKLICCVKTVIANVLNMLGVNAPEKM